MKNIFPILTIIFGFAAIIWGGGRLGDALLFRAGATVVSGTVKEYLPVNGAKGRVLKRLVVEFTGPSGETSSVNSRGASSPPAAGIGESLPVAVDPRTGSARVATFVDLYLGGLIPLFMGSVFVFYGAFRLGLWHKVRGHFRSTPASLPKSP